MALLTFYAFSLAIILAASVAAALARKTDILKRGLVLIALLHLVCAAMWAGSLAVAVLMAAVVAVGSLELSRCAASKTAESFLMALAAVSFFIFAKVFPLVLYGLFAPCLAVLVFLFLPRKGAGRPRAEAWVFLLGLVVPCAVALSSIFDRWSGHLVAMILLVQFNDTAAYFAGKGLGKRKLAWVSAISPNKTVEGYAGGACGIVAAAILLHTAIPAYPLQGMAARTAALFAAVFIFANAGDLAFSSIKRRFGVKDFSGILSAHGGVLDRFDSVLCLSPVYLFLLNAGLF